jgi:hypothetical protein
MRLLVAAFLLLIPTIQSKPTTPAEKPSVEKRDTPPITQQEQSNVPSASQDVSIDECIGCFIENAPTHHKEEADAYDPRNDPLYRRYLWATIIGVVGGFIGIVILIVQSALLRSSVKAAHKSADAHMDSESAVLTVDDGELVRIGSRLYVNCSIHNRGRTVAIIFAFEETLQFGPDQENPPNPALYQETGISIPSDFYVAAGASSPFRSFLTDRSGLSGKAALGTQEKPARFEEFTDADLEQLKNRTKTLWSYGFVRYRDVFKRSYELRFCQRYEPAMAGPKTFIVAGPPEFNRLTRYTETK